ncbi:GNAT family N-acetyltransferase [Actinoplanes sp. CA-015351]|uniref:GNAT family N-acetyltransferase n=1 Tax=Actinoplanes sp. CA-015351 TaxID=3239897 RepID=UPI003D98990B
MDQKIRVLLRELRPDDAPAVTEGETDPAFQRFLGTNRVAGEAEEQEKLVIEGLNGEFLGVITVTPELTFWVAPGARRRGVATAALRVLGEHHTGGRLELLIGWDNPVAQRVAMAAGYTREGVRREPGSERQVWSRLAGDPAEPTPRLLPDLPGGELSDGVVKLRPLGVQDVAFYTELHNLPEVVNTSVPPVPPTPAEVLRRCSRSDAQWLSGTRADLVILDEATGAPVGEIDLYYQEPPTQQAMIGYSMLPGYRGRGLTTRAAKLVALWAFAETDIVRLIAGAAPDNTGSQRVLEKAGFRREAYLKSRLPGPDGTRIDDVQYVLLAGDLLAQASSGD